MSKLEIPCPECGMRLELPDRSLLGKKAKCGKCGHKFVLAEPEEEVQLELASAAPAARRPVPPPRAPGSPPPWGAGPPVQRPQPAAPQAAPRSPAPGPAPQQGGQRFAPAPPAYPAASQAPAFRTELPVSPRVSALRKRSGRGRGWGLIVVSVLSLAGIGGYLWMNSQAEPPKKVAKNSKNGSKGGAKGTTVASASTGNKNKKKLDTILGSEDDDQAISKSTGPTRGDPIMLKMVPNGTRVVINLRLADMWANGGLLEEVRACFGESFTKWMEAAIQANCLAEPAKIQEVMLCLIPQTKGTAPDLACVVRLKGDFKKSEILEKFNGELMDDLGRPYYLGMDRAYLLYDTKTYAICPAKYAQEMVQAADNTSLTSDAIDALLQKSDRDRHMTFVFERQFLVDFGQFLVPANTQGMLTGLIDFLGDDVDCGLLSFHFGDQFHSEMHLRNLAGTPPKLKGMLEKRLNELPRTILSLVEKMDPQEVGRRRIIGRFPAMTKVFQMNTRFQTGNRLVALQTVLPERAAPNLALGAIFTWDQALRTDFGKGGSSPSGPKGGRKLPDSLAERLKLPIDVDFRNEPLYAAVAYIEEETGVKIKIEGNDLKMVGVTQNMKQQFQMDQKPATAVLDHMLTKLGLVIVLDEKNNQAILTSAKMAEERQQKVHPLSN